MLPTCTQHVHNTWRLVTLLWVTLSDEDQVVARWHSPCGPGCGWWRRSLAVAPPATLGVSSPSCRAWKRSKASWPALCRWAPVQHAANTEGSEPPSTGVFSTMDSVRCRSFILKMICLNIHDKWLQTINVVYLTFKSCSACLFIVSIWLHCIDFQYNFKVSQYRFKDIPKHPLAHLVALFAREASLAGAMVVLISWLYKEEGLMCVWL